MGQMDTLKTAKRYVLKQARYVVLTNREHIVILKSLEKWLKNGDVMDVVHISHMWHSSSLSNLPSTTPDMTLITLLLQCPPYLYPVPTILPTTFTYLSLPHFGLSQCALRALGQNLTASCGMRVVVTALAVRSLQVHKKCVKHFPR